ncbi:hypothetical protein TWF225_005497 [Orbilia oligospora]|uniref:Uncharacterized protein n=1 Tax=Orbilia oligospora TaxID=2813651 RepID=A0A7C8PMV0_ORBOL|nr:hypothetical protein TWF751_005402 [Orbilia oligospora]KAF3194880.1 hypothetical protein TWF225_005497 [Orbilia oligospora]KAF3259872.1 hypothetical protein TWF128_003864 [Orbilia oligospora]KAF3270819.1 hypothetical protein TWF217_007093 [Orbilia oligospora]KAF3292305.1 hypothetical protein TWF132_005695 [Orbilia oligospora]
MVCASHLLPQKIHPCPPPHASPLLKFIMLNYGLDYHRAANFIDIHGGINYHNTNGSGNNTVPEINIDLERLFREVDSIERRDEFYWRCLDVQAQAGLWGRTRERGRGRECVIS